MGERPTNEDLALARLVGERLFHECVTNIGREIVGRHVQQLILITNLRALEAKQS